ncbi:stretch-activated Ca2+-permeable channel component-domain-containing protein [Schizophyllum commune]
MPNFTLYVVETGSGDLGMAPLLRAACVLAGAEGGGDDSSDNEDTATEDASNDAVTEGADEGGESGEGGGDASNDALTEGAGEGGDATEGGGGGGDGGGVQGGGEGAPAEDVGPTDFSGAGRRREGEARAAPLHRRAAPSPLHRRAATPIPPAAFSASTPTPWLRGTEGWRAQWFVEGLGAGRNYTVWVVREDTGTIGGQLVSGPVYMRTKGATFPCPLAHSLPFCPSVAYAVPLGAPGDGAGSYTSTNFPAQVADPLLSSLTNFTTSLSTFACGRDMYSPLVGCAECQRRYREWVCGVGVPRCGEVEQEGTASGVYEPNPTATGIAADTLNQTPLSSKSSSSNSSNNNATTPRAALVAQPSGKIARNPDWPEVGYEWVRVMPCLELQGRFDGCRPPSVARQLSWRISIGCQVSSTRAIRTLLGSKMRLASGGIALALALPFVAGQGFLPDSQIALVRARLDELSQLSWELGTRAEALLEHDAPQWSVFADRPLPPPRAADDSGGLRDTLAIARRIVTSRGGAPGPQPLMADGSAGDPASNLVAVLLADWTGQDGGARVAKTGDGAISHRVEPVSLWSDFISMVPTSFAYAGVLSGNQSYVEEAYHQIKLYRDYLRDANAGNLWHHIVYGWWDDAGHWTTGNGWAAAGMLRVLATIRLSAYAPLMAQEQADLTAWIKEIHDAVFPHLDDSHIFLNYIDAPATDGNNFPDAAGTALLASTVYRYALMTGDVTHIPSAEAIREELARKDGGGYVHFSPEGVLRPIVNPHDYSKQGDASAEGQAFVMMLDAAYGEWRAKGGVNLNSAGVGSGNRRSRWRARCASGPLGRRMWKERGGKGHRRVGAGVLPRSARATQGPLAQAKLWGQAAKA